jgi:hypothetical protein
MIDPTIDINVYQNHITNKNSIQNYTILIDYLAGHLELKDLF